MSNYDTATILKGSANIDRIRSEIKQLIRIMEGILTQVSGENLESRQLFFDPRDKTNHNYHFPEYPDGFVWGFSYFGNGVNIRLFKVDGNPHPEIFSWGAEDKHLPIKAMMKVHSLLDRLIDDCVAAFPQIKEKLDLFVEATT